MAIVCMIVYIVFFGAVLYASSKTRNKFPGAAPDKYKKKMEKNAPAKLPGKFHFLAMEPSHFPL